MEQSLLNRQINKRPEMCTFQGRILFLTEDPELIRRQLAGEDLPWDTRNPQSNPKLRDDISTDEITPAHICFFFDETLGEFPYTGLKCGNEVPIKRGDVKKGGFVAAVSGKRRGKGSSREQSPYAEICAGIKLVIAENIERIYKQNCQNLGVLTTTDFIVIDKIRAGEEIPLSKFTAGRGRDHTAGDRVRRTVPVQRGAHAEKGFSAADQDERAPDDDRGEDFCPPHAERTRRAASECRT